MAVLQLAQHADSTLAWLYCVTSASNVLTIISMM